MVIVQHRSRRKPTGGRYHQLYRSKRKFEMGQLPSLPLMGERKIRVRRTHGGQLKFFLHGASHANVIDPKTKKSSVSKITGVTDNPANANFVRRNIMTQGTIINTELGKARITNRPGQEGAVNAVLV